MRHDSFVRSTTSFMYDITHSSATWLIHVWHNFLQCDTTHSCAARRLVHLCHDKHDIVHLCHGCLTWLIHMQHDSFTCDMSLSYMTWLISMWHNSLLCDTTHSCAAQFVHTWYMTCLFHTWHDLSCMKETCHVRTDESCRRAKSYVTREWVMYDDMSLSYMISRYKVVKETCHVCHVWKRHVIDDMSLSYMTWLIYTV